MSDEQLLGAIKNARELAAEERVNSIRAAMADTNPQPVSDTKAQPEFRQDPYADIAGAVQTGAEIFGTGVAGLINPLYAIPAYVGIREGGKQVQEWLGIRKPTTIGEKAEKALTTDLPTAAVQTGTAELGGRGITWLVNKGRQLAKAPFGNFLSTPEGQDRLRIFKEFGIEPSPADLVPNSKTLAIFEGVAGYRPVSGDVMLNKALAKIDALNTARNNLIAKGENPATIENVGLQIKREAQTALERFAAGDTARMQAMLDQFETQLGGLSTKYAAGTKLGQMLQGSRAAKQMNVGKLYSDTENLLPLKGQDVVIPTEDSIKIASDLLREETSKLKAVQDRRLISLLNEFIGTAKQPELPAWAKGLSPAALERNAEVLGQFPKPTGMTWQGMKNTRSDLLEKARSIVQANGEVTKEARVYYSLAGAIDDSMAKYAEGVGGDLWSTFLSARNASRTMHDIYDKDVLKIMNLPPEKITQKIVGTGNITLINQIRDAVGEEGIVPIKQNLFSELLKQSTKNGSVDYKILGSKVEKMRETLSELLPPAQMQMLDNLTKTGVKVRQDWLGNKTIDFLETLTGTSNERVVDAIFKPHNTANINLAKQLLSPERMDEITSAAIERVLKLSGTGNYLPVTSAREFAKYQEPLKALLPEARYNSLMDFLKLGQNMNRVETLAKNASQTGQVLMGSQIGSQILGAVTNPKKLFPVAGKLLVLPYMLAKVYTSDAATKHFTKAISVSPYSSEAATNFIRALEIAGFNVLGSNDQQSKMP